jgi:hypothetical protein
MDFLMLNPLDALRTLQENLTIAVLRRPSLSWTVKGTGLNERHFPPDLGPAFHIAMTKSQDEIHRVVLAKDARIWPLYGKRIIEWTEGRAREAARHIVRSMECSEDYNPVSTAYDDSSVPVPEVRPTPIHEQPEQRAPSREDSRSDLANLRSPLPRTRSQGCSNRTRSSRSTGSKIN